MKYCPGSDKRPWIDGSCRYCGHQIPHCSVLYSTTAYPHDQTTGTLMNDGVQADVRQQASETKHSSGSAGKTAARSTTESNGVDRDKQASSTTQDGCDRSPDVAAALACA